MSRRFFIKWLDSFCQIQNMMLYDLEQALVCLTGQSSKKKIKERKKEKTENITNYGSVQTKYETGFCNDSRYKAVITFLSHFFSLFFVDQTFYKNKYLTSMQVISFFCVKTIKQRQILPGTKCRILDLKERDNYVTIIKIKMLST